MNINALEASGHLTSIKLVHAQQTGEAIKENLMHFSTAFQVCLNLDSSLWLE